MNSKTPEEKNIEHKGLIQARTDSNSILPEASSQKPTAYSWACLILMLFISIGNQWQRFLIAYAYAIGSKNGDPTTEISTAYPQLDDVTYGLLSGLAFTGSFAVCGIFAGYVSDRVNRSFMMCFCSICWSVCSLLTGIVDSFVLLFILRFVQGIFMSGFNPCAYSVISDFFPPAYRTTANSILNVGIYLGGALSSISTVLISTDSFGWRSTYLLIGIIGIGFGTLGLVFIREPQRGQYDKKVPGDSSQSVKKPNPLVGFMDATKEVFVNPTSRYATIGGTFRFFGGYSIGFFIQKYFLGVYPENKDQYAVLYAVVVSICGFTSSIVGGLVCDFFEKRKIFMNKAYVCLFAGIMGIPTMFMCTMIQSNFYVSITGIALEYLVAECWYSPCLTMVLNSISPKNKGFAVSVFMFYSTVAGTIATSLLGVMAKSYDAENNQGLYGKILFWFVVFSYAGSLPFVYLAGINYTKLKKKEMILSGELM